MELANAGAQVRLSFSGPPLTFPLPDGIQEAGLVEAVDRDGSIRFQDGSSGPADVLLFCTGYVFSFPYLDAAQLKLQIQDQLLAPLYRHMMPPNFPSLFFIGMCKLICPFPNFHCQVQFALAVLDGSVSLPSAALMEQEVLEELQEKEQRGIQQRHLMVLQQQQWDYCSMLADTAQFPPLPPAVRSLYEEVWRQRREHPKHYRRNNYRLIADDRWELVH
ncbi:flavin-containing monooxygenase FMO GS-OX-like 7 [Notothenia coriiceps]|uniref:Flavin-containing monooxygenase n=1 Tax=Notothenia coriiceps TaxID=8208 RepID=A0A6I9Q3J6_9TELE|nr:PREDICTED: flavin-containing monooxygenase FMO GS-OX-like 7 [Notothenia coriiceps]XP_010795258.1 PREDICTED: flavin-containing monooxygenase FMO GS-OX-like 7 [Notothenia coriiceps]